MSNWTQADLDAHYERLKKGGGANCTLPAQVGLSGAAPSRVSGGAALNGIPEGVPYQGETVPYMGLSRDGWPSDAMRTHEPSPVKIKPPRMNKTEAAYAQELENQKRVGLISWWAFEPFKLRLADKTYYTPDFAVMRLTSNQDVPLVMPGDRGLCTWSVLEFHEAKGHWEDDARVKIKVAAEHFPFKFVAVRKKKQSEGGGWDVEEFRGR